MNYDPRIIKRLEAISTDVESGARHFGGCIFNERTVAEYFGIQVQLYLHWLEL